MRLTIRHRLFLAMIGLGTLPLAVALVVLAMQVRSTSSPAGTRATLDAIAASGGRLAETVDTTSLTPEGREAVRDHIESITRQTTLARRAARLSGYAYGALGLATLVAAVVLVALSLFLARRWSSYVSRPIEELVAWVAQIKRRQPLPAAAHQGGAPEFEALRVAMREMADALDLARRQELEQERLRAFRETSRGVAHEMRGPLTALRLALRKLTDVSDETTVSVLEEETARLEEMAREFSEFGRLPEGPEAEIDLTELIESAVTASLPNETAVVKAVQPGLSVSGHYEPLRRAVQNLLRNAMDVTDDRGIVVAAGRAGRGVEVIVRDYGPGVPHELRDRVFEPYFTAKAGGTGLGLALVRQTVEAHGGTVEVRAAEETGAEFVIFLPEAG